MDELSEHLDALARDGCYRVDAVMKESAFETTQLVYFVGANGSEQGPYVRKYLDGDAGLGAAYERLWRAQRSGRRFLHLPLVLDCHAVGSRRVVVMEFVRGETLADVVYRCDPSVALACDVFPKLCELFPELSGHTAEEFYRAINKAEPSLIRTEADEVTYSLHVMVRYELEKRVMHGELKVHDLPGEWNRLYKEYLGVDVPDDKHGVLQDSHWSGGSIGYFPSYALGSAYGAQLLRKMKETVDVDECLKTGNFAPINTWNREHIWQYGCLKKPGALLEQALGEKFDPTVYTQYLEEKYGEIYGL